MERRLICGDGLSLGLSLEFVKPKDGAFRQGILVGRHALLGCIPASMSRAGIGMHPPHEVIGIFKVSETDWSGLVRAPAKNAGRQIEQRLQE